MLRVAVFVLSNTDCPSETSGVGAWERASTSTRTIIRVRLCSSAASHHKRTSKDTGSLPALLLGILNPAVGRLWRKHPFRRWSWWGWQTLGTSANTPPQADWLDTRHIKKTQSTVWFASVCVTLYRLSTPEEKQREKKKNKLLSVKKKEKISAAL